MMKITFLGSGTSTGVPQIGCKCDTCLSEDPKDKRLRASVLIETERSGIIIDIGPDFRQQLLQNPVQSISGILLTHEHYDHIGGLDDVRPFGNVPVFAEKNVLNTIKRNMPYCFSENRYPGVPLIQLKEIDENDFYLNGELISPVRIMHANLPALGFRIGNMAYLTDVKTLPDYSLEKLKNLDVLILNALRINKHISHLNLKEAQALAEIINAKRTIFTHMSHDMGRHAFINSILPENQVLAYDNMTISF
jgi:phosphoribosyl 1,2-cyclic phosphate phosphodiesterase